MRVLHSDGSSFRWISPQERDDMLMIGTLRELYEDREGSPHFIGYTHEKPVKGSANNSPCSITFAGMLANVGLSRFQNGEISVGQQKAWQAKIKEVGKNPSWLHNVEVTSHEGPDYVNEKA